MPDNKNAPWLPKLFWMAACSNVLLVLIPSTQEVNHPQGEFSGLVVIGLLLIILYLAVVTAVVAAIRKPIAYGVGLALVSVPLLWWSTMAMNILVQRLAAPSIEDQEAGRGYFTTPTDRALADAIVAEDAAKVVSLAPAANLGAVGWGQMTFMRLALGSGHANPDVLAALLRAGIDADQDSSALYLIIYNEKNEALLRLVIDAGVDLNKHMGRGQWIYFARYDWPEGLALILDHGADTEAQDAMGYTEIMRAVQAESWPTAELLLTHGARIDHVGNDGRSLRDLLPEAIARSHVGIPPRIAELQARLR